LTIIRFTFLIYIKIFVTISINFLIILNRRNYKTREIFKKQDLRTGDLKVKGKTKKAARFFLPP